MSESDQPRGLRVVTFNVLPVAYESVARWAARHGHRIVLIVTTPGPPARRSTSYRGVVAQAPPETDILVTTRPRRVALPLIRALEPDLIISGSFPYRIPQEIVAVPRYGAMNLHPAPLPYYRGPNPLRLIYEGFPTMAATLHRIVEEFDAGPILSQPTAPLPEWVTPEWIRESLDALIERAIEEGTARAVAGELGTPQDESRATYAAAFTEGEHWLDWAEPARVLQRKSAALNQIPSRRQGAPRRAGMGDRAPGARRRGSIRPTGHTPRPHRWGDGRRGGRWGSADRRATVGE